GDVVALALAPLTDRLVLLPVRRGGATPSAGGATAAHLADSTAGRDVPSNRLTECRGIFLRQVDLIFHAVQAELDGLVSVAAFEVIDQVRHCLLRHRNIPPMPNPGLFEKYCLNNNSHDFAADDNPWPPLSGPFNHRGRIDNHPNGESKPAPSVMMSVTLAAPE